MGKIYIREIVESDVNGIASISGKCFKEFYDFDWTENTKNLYQNFSDKKVAVLIACQKNNWLL